MKRFLAVLLCLAMMTAVFVGCGDSSSSDDSESSSSNTEEASDTRTVTDLSGTEVEIPNEVNTYVDSWFASNAVIVMLDNAEGLVGTCCSEEDYPWMFKVSENMSNATYFEFSEDMNVEEIVALKPDVVFGYSESFREMFENVGIPYINILFSDYDTMVESIELTAEVLGGDAVEIAERYVDYLEEKLDEVGERISTLDDSEKLTVVEGDELYSELSVDGGETIIDEWITASGGINVAADEVIGTMQIVSMEQLLAWDPDVLISGTEGDAEKIMSDPEWATLTAVKNGAVYESPRGVFWWSRYGVEEALQFQWFAKLLYPDLFEDLDIEEETKYFYEEFFNYELTDENVALILSNQDPTD